jgi:hypothetical protein
MPQLSGARTLEVARKEGTMTGPTTGHHAGRMGTHLPRALGNPEVRVALVVAACLLAEAIVAKNVLDVTLDPLVQIAPMWVFLVYIWIGRRDRVTELTMMATAVLMTVAILVLYAL